MEHRGHVTPQIPFLAEKRSNTQIEQSLILIKQSPTLAEFVIMSMLKLKELLNWYACFTELYLTKMAPYSMAYTTTQKVIGTGSNCIYVCIEYVIYRLLVFAEYIYFTNIDLALLFAYSHNS